MEKHVPQTVDSKVSWTDGMAFDAELDGFHFDIDAAEHVGGRGRGPRPKGLLLVGIAGCTGMDVVSILKKMRVPISGFEVSVSGELAEEHPKKFERIAVTYAFRGEALPKNKLLRAVELSETKYCGVRATVAPNVEMSTVVTLNGERIT